jgi:peptidoglycan/LPS O-acetylase OafA/YrhL
VPLRAQCFLLFIFNRYYHSLAVAQRSLLMRGILKRATRRQSTRSPEAHRVSQLDFIRGIAILAVMEYHFFTVPVQNSWARGFEYFGKRVGWMGVDLFFVLSGFLVGGLLIQEFLKSGDIRTKRFLLRRMFKIWPAYYLYILFQICVRRHPLASFAWQNILNVQNYAGTSLSHTWSLAVEEHFYLALPFFLLVLFKSRLRRWSILILSSCCFLVLIGRVISVYALHAGDPQWKTHARVDGLLFGVILSYIFYTDRKSFEKLQKLWWALILLCLGGILFVLHEGHGTRLMWSFGYTVNYIWFGSVLILIYGYHGKLLKTVLYRIIAQIGLYSYGIYLWHLSVREPLATLASHIMPAARWGFLLISQYLAAIFLGVLLTKAVEFPMLRLRDRLIPRGPAQLPPDTA